jgi:hypothetical protein
LGRPFLWWIQLRLTRKGGDERQPGAIQYPQ